MWINAIEIVPQWIYICKPLLEVFVTKRAELILQFNRRHIEILQWFYHHNVKVLQFNFSVFWFSEAQNGDIRIRVKVESMNHTLKGIMTFQSTQDTKENLQSRLQFHIIYGIGANTIHLIFRHQPFWRIKMLIGTWIRAKIYHCETGA